MKIRSLVLIFLFCSPLLNNIIAADTIMLDTISDYHDWGWEVLLIKNSYYELAIVPELGGRVLHYGPTDGHYMWVNPDETGNIYDPETSLYGPWSNSSGYGGYKVWPAPQDRWGWPPPPYLAWGVYSYVTEHVSNDSIVIYLESNVETQKTAGLKMARRFVAYKNITLVKVEQYLINVSNNETVWSIWDVTQVIIDHDGTGDYQNLTTYFPASQDDIKIINSNILTEALTNNISTFNYNSAGGKIGVLLEDGWISFVDAEHDYTYSKVFDTYLDEDHPDQNTNFQIYVGGNYVELEVLSPEWDLPQGDTISYNEYWFLSNSGGDVYSANHAGLINDKLTYNESSNKVTGVFGIFNTGTLKISFLDESDNIIGSTSEIEVSANEEIVLSITEDIPSDFSKIILVAYNENREIIDTLDTYIAGEPVYLPGQSISELSIFPNMISPGETLKIHLPENSGQVYELDILGLNGVIKWSCKHDINGSFVIPDLDTGIYLIQLKTYDKILVGKLIIR